MDKPAREHAPAAAPVAEVNDLRTDGFVYWLQDRLPIGTKLYTAAPKGEGNGR